MQVVFDFFGGAVCLLALFLHGALFVRWKEGWIMKWSSLFICGGLVLMTGCTAPMFQGTVFEAQPRQDLTVARIATNTQQMNLEFRQLAEQVATLSYKQEQMASQIDQLSRQLAATGQSSSEVVALRQELQSVRSDRERLRKEITDDLAGRIDSIATRQQAQARKAASVGNSSVASGTASAVRTGGYEHKVEAGQTLSQIARGYGKSVEAIMQANKIANSSHIRVGQILFIPD